MKRASVRKSSTPSLGAWIPNELLALLEKAAESTGTDRSEIVRRALKEKVARTKIGVAPVDEKP
jgi:metal-responsive CopG/Arc/MetJ family transcriptional regulator